MKIGEIIREKRKVQSLTLSGMPVFYPDPSKPYDIYTYDAIHVNSLGKSGEYPTVSLGFYGQPGVVADGFDDIYAAYNITFNYPEGAVLGYSQEEGALIYMEQSSLSYCGQNVQDKTYYKVENSEYELDPGLMIPVPSLAEGTWEDYDIFWDEESKMLTLNGLDAVADGFAFGKALFLADCETMTDVYGHG